MQELSGGIVRRSLLVELPFDNGKRFVKFFRLYYRPRDDFQRPRIKAGDEVSVLFILNDLLEFKSEPGRSQRKRKSYWKE